MSRPRRIALIAVAFLGTLVYSSSFAFLPDAPRLLPIAAGVGISAGMSWVVLGNVLLVLSKRTGAPGRMVMAWFDACLVTMAIGEMVLMCSPLLILAWWWEDRLQPGSTSAVGPHLGILIAADVLMALAFVSRARRFGTPIWNSLVLWVVVLNGSFAVLMWMLARPLGYA